MTLEQAYDDEHRGGGGGDGETPRPNPLKIVPETTSESKPKESRTERIERLKREKGTRPKKKV